MLRVDLRICDHMRVSCISTT